MCGITGAIASKESKQIVPLVEESVKQLSKRGPNSFGIFSHDTICFGHTRLSILDTSNSAHQPFTDSSGRYTIVYNGEFYNYRDYVKELEANGVIFRSTSDTEVLLYLYMYYGEECLKKINGFFSFAIHDKKDNSVFIARDRFGIKPLLYYQDETKFVFASEMKAIMAYCIDKTIDSASLKTYFHLNYIPAPDSIFKQVKKLLPGHFIKVYDDNVVIKKYYTSEPYYSKIDYKISYENAQKKLTTILEESVKKRLVSDVPLGTFLSGGIDSSVITTLASRYIKNLNTFSIGYKNEPLFDETAYAKLVATKCKTNHTVFELSNNDLFEHIDEVLNYIDEPFADSSAIAVYILSKKTKKHVTVALSGDGADELFSGYNKHMAEYKMRNGFVFNPLIKLMHPFFRILPQSRNSFIGNICRQLNKYSEGINLSNSERYWRWAGFMTEDELNDFIVSKNESSLYQARKTIFTKDIKQQKGINDVLFSDMGMVLQNDMLVKVDLMSMANGLEVRVPFLDHEVVEFAYSLPSDYKINGKLKKRIVQDTFRNILPPELYNRKKHGFEVPLLKWFNTEYRIVLENTVFDQNHISEQGLFNPESISLLKSKLFSNNPGDAIATTWALIVFQRWWNKYILN